MVSTCANPACNQQFTYFGTGELLVKSNAATGQQELYWLCQQCARDWQVSDDLIPLISEMTSTGKRKTEIA